WEANDVTDKFSLLALTQGLMPTDNFEFLGLFNPTKHFRFVTDLAGLSHISLEKGTVSVGDTLTYETEFSKQAFRELAVKIYKGSQHVGYIKNIHNNVFIKSKGLIKLSVKAIEQNGVVKNIFVLVDCSY
ncbi:MAG TPA: hypothetical protein VNZ86_12935, partial [Bacteroidia bacterium]|nr:hypothetical protein [Bacteroidia bacterium]